MKATDQNIIATYNLFESKVDNDLKSIEHFTDFERDLYKTAQNGMFDSFKRLMKDDLKRLGLSTKLSD